MMDGRMRQTTGKREIEEKAAKRENSQFSPVMQTTGQDTRIRFVQ